MEQAPSEEVVEEEVLQRYFARSVCWLVISVYVRVSDPDVFALSGSGSGQKGKEMNE